MNASWASTILSIIGAFFLSKFAYQAITFIRIYTQPSKLYQYHSPTSWALVTGASDGIGHAIARELANRKFNVILHGRNISKLTNVATKLRSAFPRVKFHVVVADASLTGSASHSQIQEIVHEITSQDFDLRILINNVGGVPSSMLPRFKSFDETTCKDNEDIVAMNVGFTTQLTAALLPLLLKNGPSLVMTIGSITMVGMPWLSMYSGTKAFLMSWSAGLAREMKAQGKKIEVIGMMTGEVTGVSHRHDPPSFSVPDARAYASAVLDRVGCGHAVVNGCWKQGLISVIVNSLPDFVITPIFIDAMRKQKKADEKQQ